MGNRDLEAMGKLWSVNECRKSGPKKWPKVVLVVKKR